MERPRGGHGAAQRRPWSGPEAAMGPAAGRQNDPSRPADNFKVIEQGKLF